MQIVTDQTDFSNYPAYDYDEPEAEVKKKKRKNKNKNKNKNKKNKKKRRKNKNKKRNKNKNERLNGEIPEETIIKFHETFDSLVGDGGNESDFRGPRQSGSFLENADYDDEYYDNYDYDLQPLGQGGVAGQQTGSASPSAGGGGSNQVGLLALASF